MSSVSKALALLILCSGPVLFAATPALRVCADPNNLPFSNQQQQGFENHLADMVAKDLGMKVVYDWYPQRGAFFKKTLNANQCDVVMGVPTGIPVADTTQPYYRSTYVFVSRRDSGLHIVSFDDPRLRTLRIGVHITGDQDSNMPPVAALLNEGIVRNMVGYSIYGNLAEKDPPADLMRAVVQKNVNVAVVWGPLAGYFAKHASVPLDITPVDPVSPRIPLTFDISMGVRRGDDALRRQLDAEIARRRPEIRQLLASYGVPVLPTQSSVQPAVPGGY